jgi:hypothetical protein
MKNNYFGIFNCYNPGGITRNVIMAGMFTVDEIYNIGIEIDKELKKIYDGS